MDKPIKLQNNQFQNGFVDHTRFESVDDGVLINRILEGEIDLFEVILRRYNQKLYRVVRSYLSEEEAVREVVHSAYIKAYEHLEQFRSESQFSTWLVRIAINEALTHLNRRDRTSEADIDRLNENGNHKELVNRNDPEQEAVRADLKQLLEEAIDTLPPKYRSVLIMREIEQMSTRETARCLGITRANVKVRLHRAKRKLRAELENRVMDQEVFDFKGARCDRMVRAVMNDVYERIASSPELAVREWTEHG
ncbi:MAG: RNA polymerase sigma factor [Balneolaceae bacterium]|nr:RNA polymerase sigma factor [Balneolaceae bacterium]